MLYCVSCKFVLFSGHLCDRGQNALHLLGQYGKENAAAIFELFMECMPQYPINEPDSNGNTGEYSLLILL